MKHTFSKKLLFIPFLIIGVVTFVLLIRTRPHPVQVAVKEKATPVRVITAETISVVPRIIGYGYIQAAQEWSAVAEVAGKIVEVHPQLKKGAIIAKGELLVRIDPAKRLTQRTQSASQVKNLLAQLEKLEQQEKDLRQTLKVEQQSLALSRKSLQRNTKLLTTGTISRSEFDAVEQAYLAQENKVQSVLSELNTIPSQRQSLLADLQSSRSKLEEAELDLAKTFVHAPFDMRLTAVTVEKGQAVSVNQVIANADSMGTSEAAAQMPLYMFRHVLPRGGNPLTQGGSLSQETFRQFMDLDAFVRVTLGSDTLTWTGRVSRLSDSVDQQTRTIGVYVAVDDPYLKMESGRRPPLLPNMFCEVELQGNPNPPAIVIPRSALHGNAVYTVNSENRLERKTVEVDFEQGEIAVLRSGIETGETVIITDLVPAVEGMLLNPIQDAEAVASLRDEATGGGSVR